LKYLDIYKRREKLTHLLKYCRILGTDFHAGANQLFEKLDYRA